MLNLRVISISQLQELNDTAMTDLKHAVIQHGFFYLDLRSQKTQPVLKDMDLCVSFAKELHELPMEEKLKYDIDELGPHKLNGYKPIGRNEGIEKGKRDGFEAYLLPRDGICNPSPGDADNEAMFPDIVHARQAFLKRHMNQLHQVGEEVLRALSLILSLPEQQNFERSHRPNRASTSALGLLKYRQLWTESTQLGHGSHTDVGSLTLLFCTQPGLQVLDPVTDRWEYVLPKQGHAIVNIGDSLRFLSELRLKSCLHRVVPYPGTQVTDRYSCAYFLRPEVDAVFADDSGTTWRSVDWHDRKYVAFRAPMPQQLESAVLTGKAGYTGLWQQNDPHAV